MFLHLNFSSWCSQYCMAGSMNYKENMIVMFTGSVWIVDYSVFVSIWTVGPAVNSLNFELGHFYILTFDSDFYASFSIRHLWMLYHDLRPPLRISIQTDSIESNIVSSPTMVQSIWNIATSMSFQKKKNLQWTKADNERISYNKLIWSPVRRQNTVHRNLFQRCHLRCKQFE